MFWVEALAGGSRVAIKLMFIVVRKILGTQKREVDAIDDPIDDLCYVQVLDTNEEARIMLEDNSRSMELDYFKRHDPRDTMYQEFDDSNTRPKLSKWILYCMWQSLLITILPFVGILIPGGLTAAFNLIFVDVCNITLLFPGNKPKIFYGVLTETILVYMWCPVCLVFIFPWSTIRRKCLILVPFCFALIDSLTYSIQLIMGYSTKVHSVATWSLWVTSVALFSREIASQYQEHFCKQLLLTLKIPLQFVLGWAVMLFTLFYCIPLFLQSTPQLKIILAAFLPLPGIFCKLLCRLVASRSQEILHPGKLHFLVMFMSVGCSICYRFFHVSMTSLKSFALLGIFHAASGFVGRCTLLYRDRFYNFLIRRCKVKSSHARSSQSTAVELRFKSDLILTEYIIELSSVTISQMVPMSYSILHKLPRYPNTEYKVTDYIYDFLARVGLVLGLEGAFWMPTLIITTYQINLPLVKLWRRKWKSYIFAIIILSCCTLMYFSNQVVTRTLLMSEIIDQQKVLFNGTVLIKCNQTNIVPNAN